MRRTNVIPAKAGIQFWVRANAKEELDARRSLPSSSSVGGGHDDKVVALIFSCALLLLAATAATQASLPEQAQKLLRAQSKEPLTLSADRAEWRSDGPMIYEGHVRLVSGTLTLEGNRVEVHSLAGDQVQAEVSGNPARLVHAAQNNSPEVSAQSNTLVLDSRAGLVQLNGEARLVRGAETLAGDSIRYDVAGRRIRAAGGSGRIRMEVPSSSLAPVPQP